MEYYEIKYTIEDIEIIREGNNVNISTKLKMTTKSKMTRKQIYDLLMENKYNIIKLVKFINNTKVLLYTSHYKMNPEQYVRYYNRIPYIYGFNPMTNIDILFCNILNKKITICKYA